jgi:hypothetical protein
MTTLITLIDESKSCRDIDRLVENNISRLPNPFNRSFFCSMANRKKIELTRIKREAKKSFKLYEKN